MRRIAAGNHERSNLQPQQILGFCTGRGVAIEQRARHPRDQQPVTFRIELSIRRGESGVVADHRGPRTAARIFGKALAALASERGDFDHAVLLDIGQMLREALVRIDPIFRTADRPVQQHARCRLRMRHGKRDDRRATHASAHQMRLRDPQVVEEAFALRDVVGPRDAFDTSA